MEAPEDPEREISRYREGPDLLEQAVVGLRESQLDARPAGGGWSVREIVHHVADGDDIWKMGIKMALGNEQAEFDLGWYSSLPQVTWSDRWAYSRRSIGASLSLLRATREHVIQLLASVPDAWNRSVVVRTPKGGIEQVPVGFVIQMQADHVIHHVERIHAILQEGRRRLTKVMSACGVICSDCAAYMAASKGSAYQQEAADAWSRIYGFQTETEKMTCGGCLSSDERVFHTSVRCAARRCCLSKGLGSCAECPEESCELLEKAQSNWDTVPEVGARLSGSDFEKYAQPYCGHRARLEAARQACRDR